MTGRRQDAIWQHFIKVKENDKVRAKCKYCKKEICALVARMKLHIQHKCKSTHKDEESDQFEMDDIDLNTKSERQNCKYI